MAEIPTFQAGRIDASAYARRIAANAHLTVAGRPATLVPVGHALAHPPGAGGLRTTRLEVALAGPRIDGPVRLAYRDGNYADRIGWKEVVVGARTPSRSDELRAYPKDHAPEPARRQLASTQVAPGPGPDVAPALSHGRSLQAPDRVADSGFARLIGRRHLSALVILASLAAALFWGAAHALSPGHGKTIVTAYLVGRRGTAVARRAARPDRDRDAHCRSVRARPRDARALAARRPRPPLPVAEPGLGPARRRDRRLRPRGPRRAIAWRTRTATSTTTITITAMTTRPRPGSGRCSPSASPAACFPARRRSSSCSPRSRSTASRSGCS